MVFVVVNADGQSLRLSRPLFSSLKMLMGLIERVSQHGVQWLETTISPGNDASEALFRKAFRLLDVEPVTRVIFSRENHFNGQHDDEVLYRAGPFSITSKSFTAK